MTTALLDADQAPVNPDAAADVGGAGPASPVRPSTCSAVNLDGSPCRGKLLPGRPWCFSHDPNLADRRLAGARRGGNGRTRQLAAQQGPPPEIEVHLRSGYEILGFLESVAINLLLRRLDPKEANSLFLAANVALRAKEVELTERLEALEKALLADGPGFPDERAATWH